MRRIVEKAQHSHQEEPLRLPYTAELGVKGFARSSHKPSLVVVSICRGAMDLSITFRGHLELGWMPLSHNPSALEEFAHRVYGMEVFCE